MKNHEFFSMSKAKQPVNQWLCIALLALWTFWFMLYFVVEKTKRIGESYFSITAYEITTE